MRNIQIFLILTAFVVFAFGHDALADVVKMKSGESYEGKILYEADDIVRIEVQISESIKETKILSTADIASIDKTPEDQIAFEKIKAMIPTPSLQSTEQYKGMLATGPEMFLTKFPASQYKEEVEKIKATLEEELDKVERGNIKLNEVWLTPQDQQEFQTRIQSEIALLKMKSAKDIGNYNGMIGAMREFEVIQENYYGTPAFPEAIKEARNIIPILGGQLQGMLRDVEYRNAEWEKNKAILQDEERARVEAAREKEEATFQQGLELDKKAGIKWVRLNPRSKSSIEGYLTLAKSELEDLKAYNVEALEEQSKYLVEADELIAKKQFLLAEAKIKNALAVEGTKVTTKKSSKSRKSFGKESYVAVLQAKLKERMAAEAAAEKALQEAKEAEALTREMQQSGEKKILDVSTQKEGEGEEKMAEEKKEEEVTSFAALAQADTKKKEEEEEKKESTSKKKSSSKSVRDEDDEEEERSRPPVADDGGGFPFKLLVPIITVLLIVAVVLMKVLGIGAKKEE